MSIRAKLVVVLGLCAMLRFAGAADDPQVIRASFVAAMQRVRQNVPETADSTDLKAYALYDYLVAARLRRDLAKKPDETLDAAIDGFLQSRGAEPVTRGLRREWLASLAERRRWDWFIPRSEEVSDPQLICDRLQGKLVTGDTDGLAQAALARWSVPQKPPVECSEVFAWLKRQNLLTPALAEAKVRAALAADNPRLARTFAADVPVVRVAALLEWSDLLESPQAALNVLATHPALAVDPDALAGGFDKLARSNAAEALDLLPTLLERPGVTPALRSRLQRAAALGAAYSRDPRANAAFDALPAEAIDAAAAEWQVRAALWVGDYGKALHRIESMPASLATQPRWRYWRARATAATSGADSAAPLFAEIADLRDYYGYLAADRLHRDYHLNARASPDDGRKQAALAADPGMIRARELFACDMADDAAAEWASVVGSAEPAVKVQAAHLASDWGWYAQAIATLAQAGEWDDVRLRYPRPYADAVAAGRDLADVPADWILSVMRQESLFRRDAVSRADARGLMQMLPGTAVSVARRWHLSSPRKDSLFEPGVAVPLGAAYLRELLDRYGGKLELCLAAYNAGPAAVSRWLPSAAMDADVWIENIPYTETRGYVQHILEHIVAFAYVSGKEPPRLDVLMPAVEPMTALLW
jgi:soluble lytic murein transglycosylase